MKILVSCRHCGQQLSQITKSQVSDADLSMYEQSSQCEEHGPNEYERDEDGIIISQITSHVMAIKVSE